MSREGQKSRQQKLTHKDYRSSIVPTPKTDRGKMIWYYSYPIVFLLNQLLKKKSS